VHQVSSLRLQFTGKYGQLITKGYGVRLPTLLHMVLGLSRFCWPNPTTPTVLICPKPKRPIVMNSCTGAERETENGLTTWKPNAKEFAVRVGFPMKSLKLSTTKALFGFCEPLLTVRQTLPLR